MTLEEKAALLVGSQNHYEPGHEATSSSSNVLKGAAGTTSSIERLGIPATMLADGPAGLRIDPIREGGLTNILLHGIPCGDCFGLFLGYSSCTPCR